MTPLCLERWLVWLMFVVWFGLVVGVLVCVFLLNFIVDFLLLFTFGYDFIVDVSGFNSTSLLSMLWFVLLLGLSEIAI